MEPIDIIFNKIKKEFIALIIIFILGLTMMTFWQGLILTITAISATLLMVKISIELIEYYFGGEK